MSDDSARAAPGGLSEAARALLRDRGGVRRTDASSTRVVVRGSDAADAPLSSFQESIWFVSRLDEGRGLYNVPTRVRLQGKLDVQALERSLAEIFRRHEILRSRVKAVGDCECQSVMTDYTFSLAVVDIRELAEPARSERLSGLAYAEAGKPFDLTTGPFARATLICPGPDEHVLLFTPHHVAFDGWSVSVFYHELSALYDAFAAGKASPLSELTIQYADFAAHQRKRLQSPAVEADLAYWEKQLAGAPPLLELPSDRPRSNSSGYTAHNASIVIEPALAERLHALARANGATLFMTMLAAYQTLLSRLSGTDDVVVGIPLAGRTSVETESLLGCFINMLPLRMRIGREITFRELLANVRDASLEAYSHQESPFEALVERLQPKRIPGRSPVAQVLFNFRNTPPLRAEFGGLRAVIEPAPISSMLSEFEIDIVERPEGISCVALYRADLFDDETVARWLGHFRTLLEAIVDHPDERVSRLPLMSESERQHIVADWNANSTPPDYETCVHKLVEAQVRRTPDAIAVVAGCTSLTYAELNSRANRLARDLAARGVGPDVVVGVCMEPCADVIIALLAVLKAGGAYVPLDPAHPADRLAYMVSDSDASIVLTHSGLIQRLGAISVLTICMDTQQAVPGSETGQDADEIDSQSAVTPDDIVYVAYTSGSTGRPKGAMNTHRGVCNFLLRTLHQYHIGSADVALHRTRLSFDPSVREIFGALISGARILVAGTDEQGDPDQLVRLIHEHGVTVMGIVPSLLGLLLEVPDVATRAASLRVVTCGGEAMSVGLMERFHSVLATSLNNHYGPSEAAVSGTRWVCERETLRHVVPIGRPYCNVYVYILDREGEPVPVGVTGELYLGGVGVGRGYRNHPELTAERFVPDGFCGKPGSRMYRTGDLARFDANGVIEFLGRADNQLKLHGIRIEPGEIEAVLMSIDGVRECAVIAREDQAGDVRLVAYIVKQQGHDVSERTIGATLRKRLLPQMMPSAFVFLERFPLTSGRKIDRRALPPPSLQDQGREGERRRPVNPVQHELHAIWSAMLGHPEISITEDFFDLGGHSLLAMSMMDRVAKLFGVHLPMSVLFEQPTIHHLADSLVTKAGLFDAGAVCVQHGDTGRSPLFLFHGDYMGGGLYCRRLVRYLDPGQPVYVIAPHIPGGRETVEEMAADALPHMRQIQATGPYFVAGYCNGGMVALETARRLRAVGENVAFLAVIDAGAKNVQLRRLYGTIKRVTATLGVDSRRQQDLLVKVNEPALRILREDLPPLDVSPGPAARAAFACALTVLVLRRTLRRGWRVALDAAGIYKAEKRSGPLAGEVSGDERLRLARNAYIARALQSYAPGPYDGTITLIAAESGGIGKDESQLRHWRSVGRINVITIPCDHSGVVTSHIAELGAALGEQMPRTQ